jgi:DNA polymerase-1
MKKLLLIDTHALVHRFFHALPPLTSPSGKPAQALYGISGMLIKVFLEQQPDFIAAASDRPEKTFRKEQFSGYKVHRPPAADALVSQLIAAPEIYEAFSIPLFSKAGYEADDIIGTLVEHFSGEADLATTILSGDLDILQLVSRDRVQADIIKTGVSETVLYNEAMVRERYGFPPNRIPEYKGLLGDPSDNIPGVKGIGKKTATELLEEFKTLEEIYENIGLVKNKVAEKLTENRENAFMSRSLGTIRRDVPIELPPLPALAAKPLDTEKLRALFTRYGFESLLRRLGRAS